jgi:hypothetical protein
MQGPQRGPYPAEVLGFYPKRPEFVYTLNLHPVALWQRLLGEESPKRGRLRLKPNGPGFEPRGIAQLLVARDIADLRAASRSTFSRPYY